MSEQKRPFTEFGPSIDYIHYTRPFHGSYNMNTFIFEGYKNEYENLYMGKIPFNVIVTEDTDGFYKKTLKEFFSNSITNSIDSFNPSFLFAKWADLTRIWFEDKGFKGLLGAHWNPRIKKVIVHPGGQRSKIVRMFPLYDYNFVFFNTNGYQADWISDMKPIDMRTLELDFNMSIGGIVLDHGSVIPHTLWMGKYNIDDEAEKSRIRLVKKAKNIKLFFKNKKLLKSLDDAPFLKKFIVDKKEDADYIIQIEAFNVSSFWYNLTRTLLLSFTDNEFEDKEIKVLKNK